MNELTINPFASSQTAVAPASSSAGNADTARSVAEVQAALVAARMAPRDQRVAMDRILNACTRPTLAEKAVYSFARGGSEISGASIRLAEAVAQQWGNLQYGIRELSNKNGKSEVQAFAWDIETNTRREITFSVPHVRYSRKGQTRLEDPRDIYELIANQGSRRLRACILGVIPGDVVEAAVNQCLVTMKTSVDVTPDGIKKLVEAFKQFNVSKTQLEAFCQCRIDAIRPAQMVRLRNVYTSLRDGFATVDDFFESEEKPADPKALSLEQRVAAQAAQAVTEAVKEPAT